MASWDVLRYFCEATSHVDMSACTFGDCSEVFNFHNARCSRDAIGINIVMHRMKYGMPIRDTMREGEKEHGICNRNQRKRNVGIE